MVVLVVVLVMYIACSFIHSGYFYSTFSRLYSEELAMPFEFSSCVCLQENPLLMRDVHRRCHYDCSEFPPVNLCLENLDPMITPNG